MSIRLRLFLILAVATGVVWLSAVVFAVGAFFAYGLVPLLRLLDP